MNTAARNILSLTFPVLLLTFGFLAFRAGIISNEGGKAITGLLCLFGGTLTLYWWLENMLYPPILRWFRQRRELQIELEQYRLDQEAYASWEEPDYEDMLADYKQFLLDSADADEFIENRQVLDLFEDHSSVLTPVSYVEDDDYHGNYPDQETDWMSIWWDEEYRRDPVPF